MKLRVLPFVLAGLVAGAGCGAGVADLDVTVKSATLSDTDLLALVIIGGATWGSAQLAFEDTRGVVRDVPISFGGPSGGLLMDVHTMEQDFLFDGSTKTELRIPKDGVKGSELFGVYSGGGGGIALGLGLCGLSIDNDAGVALVIEGPCGGLGAAHTESWLTLSEDGDVTTRK